MSSTLTALETTIILCLSLMIIITIIGNILVCLSVVLVRKLRSPSNYLLVSLAISDLCVAILVMPLALNLEIKGYWDLGPTLCDMWVSFDVTSCTASILNLCMISVDRYLTITKPLTYGVKRTTKRMLAFIAIVWVSSCLISIPPLLVLGNEHGTLEEPSCQVSQHIVYQLYATLGAFYIPLGVMIILYYKIYGAAKSVVDAELRSLGHTNNSRDDRASSVCAANNNNNNNNNNRYFSAIKPLLKSTNQSGSVDPKDDNNPSPVNGTSDDVTGFIKSSEIDSPYFDSLPPTNHHHHHTTTHSCHQPHYDECVNPLIKETGFGEVFTSCNGLINNCSTVKNSCDKSDQQQRSSLSPNRCHHKNFQSSLVSSYKRVKESMLSAATKSSSKRRSSSSPPSSSSSPRPGSRCYQHHNKNSSSCTNNNNSNNNSNNNNNNNNNNGIVVGGRKSLGDRFSLVNTNEKRRTSSMLKERKASITLGVIMTAFTACWLPFFILALLRPFSKTVTQIPHWISSLCYWLGLANSMLNPIIYVTFHHDFRKAFRYLLCLQCSTMDFRLRERAYQSQYGVSSTAIDRPAYLSRQLSSDSKKTFQIREPLVAPTSCPGHHQQTTSQPNQKNSQESFVLPKTGKNHTPL